MHTRRLQPFLRTARILLIAGACQAAHARPPDFLVPSRGVMAEPRVSDHAIMAAWEIIVGQIYVDRLIDAVENSDKIEVVEHSDPNARDWDEATGESRAAPYQEYAVVVLSSSQRADLRQALEGMPVAKDSTIFMCHSPHHTLRFHHAGKVSEMVVCFTCRRIDWKGGTFPPRALYPILENLVRSVGMNPKGPFP